MHLYFDTKNKVIMYYFFLTVSCPNIIYRSLSKIKFPDLNKISPYNSLQFVYIFRSFSGLYFVLLFVYPYNYYINYFIMNL